jgi:hypothetical protein
VEHENNNNNNNNGIKTINIFALTIEKEENNAADD